MMRGYISYFLVINIFFCYSDFHFSAFASNNPNPGKNNIGCHTNSYDSKEFKSIHTSYTLNKTDGRVSSDCCLKTLTNIFPDINKRIQLVSIDNTKSPIIDNVKCHLKKLTNNALRDHDPPDLCISHSTLLL